MTSPGATGASASGAVGCDATGATGVPIVCGAIGATGSAGFIGIEGDTADNLLYASWQIAIGMIDVTSKPKTNISTPLTFLFVTCSAPS